MTNKTNKQTTTSTNMKNSPRLKNWI